MSFEPITEKSSVIHRLSNDWIILQDETVRLDSLLKRIKSKLDVSNAKMRAELLDGISAEILREGGNWEKGKIRVNVSIEFCPDPINSENASESNGVLLQSENNAETMPGNQEDHHWPPTNTSIQ